MTIAPTASPPRLTRSSTKRISLPEHLELHGHAPVVGEHDRQALIDEVSRAGLRGRGGASFPTATKLTAVAESGRDGVVVVNGAEGEPASAKDRWLLERSPHLVLDGSLLAAAAVGASEVIVCVGGRSAGAWDSVAHAFAELDATSPPPIPMRLVAAPASYLAGEESALVRFLNGGPAKPTFIPPRPFESGVGRRPTLVQNVETLAHLALIARHGADWFRQAGTASESGTALVTLSGGVAVPGVYEIEPGTPLRDLLGRAGGATDAVRALLLGGYFGSWVDVADARNLVLDEEHLRPLGTSFGSGVIAVLTDSDCGVAETARVLAYLSDEAAGQCGPCTNGLGAIAGAVSRIARGAAEPDIDESLARWCAMVPGRGACHHPDGAVRFAVSALNVFQPELADHRQHGLCAHCTAPAVLPVPQSTPNRGR